MESQEIEHWAKVLNDARLSAKAIEQISNKLPHFDRMDAYKIQEQGMKLRLQAGEKIIGQKMGLTSEQKRVQMNLDSPLYGELTDKMQVQLQGQYKLQGQIHPKIEPEIAFLMKKELKGKVSLEEALDAIDCACACMEILDSRYQGFKYFSMEDVISDNSSSSQFVLGPWKKDLKNLDWKSLKMEMFVNDISSQKGVSEDISGHPVQSLVELAHLMSLRNRSVLPGMIVLAGAATPAVAMEPGMRVKLVVDHFENVEIEVVE